MVRRRTLPERGRGAGTLRADLVVQSGLKWCKPPPSRCGFLGEVVSETGGTFRLVGWVVAGVVLPC